MAAAAVIVRLVAARAKAVISGLGIGFDPDSIFANMMHGLMYFLPIYLVTLIVGGTRLHLTPSGTTLETPQLTVQSPQSTFTGKVTVQGLLSYQAGLSGRAGGGGGNVISGGLAMEGGSITHDGKNIGGTHTHPGDSGGTTGAPR